MQVSSAAHQILCISQLAPGYEYDAFTAICRAGRLRHADLGATGALLFDGHRFCQLLQGATQDVRALMNDVAREPCLEHLLILFDGTIDAAALQASWSSGYCDVHELDVFDRPDGARGEAAVAAFRAILSRADLAP